MIPRPRISRKLLVASVGVAAVSYVACKKAEEPQVVGNLVAPMVDAAAIVPPGNLMPPPPPLDAQPTPSMTATTPATADAGAKRPIPVPRPPPPG